MELRAKSEVMKTLKSNIILGFKELTEYYDALKKPPKLHSEVKESLDYFRTVLLIALSLNIISAIINCGAAEKSV
jgi:hypothetical protein